MTTRDERASASSWILHGHPEPGQLAVVVELGAVPVDQLVVADRRCGERVAVCSWPPSRLVAPSVGPGRPAGTSFTWSIGPMSASDTRTREGSCADGRHLQSTSGNLRSEACVHGTVSHGSRWPQWTARLIGYGRRGGARWLIRQRRPARASSRSSTSLFTTSCPVVTSAGWCRRASRTWQPCGHLSRAVSSTSTRASSCSRTRSWMPGATTSSCRPPERSWPWRTPARMCSWHRTTPRGHLA